MEIVLRGSLKTEVNVIKAHKYQVPIISSVVRALKRDGKTLMVMATGTGKTITGALVAQRLLGRKGRMLFLCHNNDILRQAMGAYRAVFNGSRELGMFTGEEKADPKSVDFLFASFQTMKGWREKFEPDAFDMIVVDESHHSHAETYRPTIEYFRPRYLLGMTATPDREDGQDIRNLFGTPSVELTLEEAIARKYLSDIDYKLMTVGTASRDAIKELARRVKAGERITLRELNDNIFIERLDSDIADEIMGYKAQGIIFCTDIKQAEGMAKLLKKARPYHSKLDRRELDADLEGFRKGRLKYLLTVDMFNEGIDVPDTELVVFLRSTESKTVYLQQLGRGLRKAFNKTHVTVLDFVGNCDRIKNVSEFMDRIDDFGPEGGGRERGERLRREIDASGIIFNLDQESRDVLDIMRRLGSDNMADIDGKIVVDGVVYYPVSVAAELLNLSSKAVQSRVDSSKMELRKIVGRTRMNHGRFFYAIQDLERICADLLLGRVMEGEGTIIVKGKAFKLCHQLVKELGLVATTLGGIRDTLNNAKIPFEMGRAANGRLEKFYDFAASKSLLKPLTEMPRADTGDIVSLNGRRWATAKLLESKFGVKRKSLSLYRSRHMGAIQGLEVYDGERGGVNVVFDLEVVKRLIPSTESVYLKKDGSAFAKGEVWVSKEHATKYIELSYETLSTRVKQHVSNIRAIEAFSLQGKRVVALNLKDLKRACSDLVEKPKADKRGFLKNRDGMWVLKIAVANRYGWSIQKVMYWLEKLKDIRTFEGRDSHGTPQTLYHWGDVQAAIRKLPKKVQ